MERIHFRGGVVEAEGGRVVKGTAVPYGVNGVPSSPGGTAFRVSPGALRAAADASGGVILNAMHQPGEILARSIGGNLDIDFEADGGKRVDFTAKVVKSPRGDNALADVRSRNLPAASIEAVVEESHLADDGVREVTKATLHAIALVDRPGFPGTDVHARRRSASTGHHGPAIGKSGDSRWWAT